MTAQMFFENEQNLKILTKQKPNTDISTEEVQYTLIKDGNWSTLRINFQISH